VCKASDVRTVKNYKIRTTCGDAAGAYFKAISGHFPGSGPTEETHKELLQSELHYRYFTAKN
jgi:hypothetical protein